MSSYSDDLEKIRKISWKADGLIDYFKALCQMQDLAMELANEKFQLSMEIAMRDGKEFRPSWTARNSEEWGEVGA